MDELFAQPARLLFYDIETAPMLSYHWDAKTDYIGHHLNVSDDRFILCWSAKWSDEEDVLSARLTQKQARTQNDVDIVVKLGDLMREADYVVAHNGNRFDYKRVNTRIAVKKQQPLGRVQSIDTLTISRSSFDFPYNNLDYLARRFGVGQKFHTTFDLWDRCYRADVPALKEMEEYNRQDVRLLEDVFYAMAPYAKTLPRLFDSPEWRGEFCPYCGFTKAQAKDEGVPWRTKAKTPYRTKVNNFTKWFCGNCGRTYRSWDAIGSKKSGSIGL